MHVALYYSLLSPGQSVSRTARPKFEKPGSTSESVKPGKTCTWVASKMILRSTLVGIKFARRSKQVVQQRLATQPKSTQVEWRPLTQYYAYEIENTNGLLYVFFLDLRLLGRKLASPFGQSTLVSTKVDTVSIPLATKCSSVNGQSSILSI